MLEVKYLVLCFIHVKQVDKLKSALNNVFFGDMEEDRKREAVGGKNKSKNKMDEGKIIEEEKINEGENREVVVEKLDVCRKQELQKVKLLARSIVRRRGNKRG